MLGTRQLAACALALAVAFAAGHSFRAPAPTPTPDDLAGVMSRLRQRGLDLRAYTPEGTNGEVGRSLFLADGPRDIGQLKALPRDPEFVGRWRGVVFAEELADPTHSRLEGAGVLHCGHVVFFGDPGMLARIREALAE
jgi:hypothetical protein